MPPCPASNFVLGERRAYSRDDGTPGWEALEEIVGGLEGGAAVSFASGVAGLAVAGQARGRWTVHRIDSADVVLQSATKFIGGHSDLLGGIVTVRDANLLASLRHARELAGATPGTLGTFLAVRGIRTLSVRLERAQGNAMTPAERLARHPNVTLTRYPGLASHPTHEAARRQLKGFGTIISFDVRGDAATADAVCGGLRLIRHATSLGR